MSKSQAPLKQQQRRKVLTEEEYTEGLSRVVQRNYFPDLPHLAETAALHDRRAAGDVAGAVAIRRAMRQRQDTEERERLEEQAAEEQKGTTIRSTPRPLHLESLTNFHTRVTSVDNADFEEQQAKDVEATRKRQRLEYGKWARIHNGSATTATDDPIKALPPSNSLLASPLPLASDQFNATPHRKSIQQFAQESQQQQQAKNHLFLMPGGTVSKNQQGTTTTTTLALPGAATRSTTTTSTSSQPPSGSHTTMPPPSLVKGSLQTQVSSLDALRVEYIPKNKDTKTRKRIEPAATRFPPRTTTTTTTTALSRYHHHCGPGLNLEESSSSWASESEASSVATLNYYSSTTTDLDESPLVDLATERRLGKLRHLRELETMVQMTPVIVPGGSGKSKDGDDDNDDDEPLMTWGEVSATPLVLGRQQQETTLVESHDSGEPSFGLTHSARDNAAEHARRHLEKRSRLAASATPQRKTTMTRPGSDTLLFGGTKRQRPVSARSASSFGTALRSSYTTPLSSRKGSSRRRSTGRPGHDVHRATPKLRPGSLPTPAVSTKSSQDVTKGLLQLSSS